MREQHDEEIQRLLDAGLRADHLSDTLLYTHVYQALETAPDVPVADIAPGIIQALQRRKAWQAFYVNTLIILAGSLTAAAVFVLAAGQVNGAVITTVLTFIREYYYGLIYLSLLLLLLHVANRLLLNYLPTGSHS